MTHEYDTQAEQNPFRYFGYMWDEENGFLYGKEAWNRYKGIKDTVKRAATNIDRSIIAYETV